MNLALFLPETVLSVIIIVLLFVALLRSETAQRIINPLMLIAGSLLLAACLYGAHQTGELFYSTYRLDLLSQGFKVILAGAFLFTILFSKHAISIPASRKPEYFIFLSTATLGMMMLTSAVDLLSLYISLELSSYSLYLLAALRVEKRNAESSVKYLIFGAATSGFLLWGLSLIAGLTGTTSLIEITKNLAVFSAQPAFILALFFVSFAFLFKLSSFPLHFWAPDVYECAATPVTNYIATASKAAAVAILIRLFILTGVPVFFVALLGVFAFLSMTLGNAVALVQRDVKRLLAYSSIAQAGYILTGLLAGSFEGYSSSFFYAFAYVLMNTAAFLVVLLVAKDSNNDNPQISHFDGLAERSPFLALILLISLLSLAGIPPLVGFTGKWILFSAAMDKGHWFLVLWGVLNSVVSLFYYLTLVKHAYLEKPNNPAPFLVPIQLRALGLVLFFGIMLLGVFPNFFLSFAQQAITEWIR